MKVSSLNYSVLLNFAWYSLDLEKLNRMLMKINEAENFLKKCEISQETVSSFNSQTK